MHQRPPETAASTTTLQASQKAPPETGPLACLRRRDPRPPETAAQTHGRGPLATPEDGAPP
ncbi:hypothetical protein NDU88_000380, partial [Pleurodeles waltl]